MRWASAISTAERFELALEEALASIATQLEETPPDLVFLFATPAYGETLARAHHQVRERLGGPRLVGCTAVGVLGDGREVERRPAISITAAILPGVEIHTFHVAPEALPEADDDTDVWRERLGTSVGGSPHFILLPDPFSCDIERILRGLDYAFPDSAKVGGVPSTGTPSGRNTLWVDDRRHDGGLVGVMLEGNISVDAIVAQGCRPIGNPMFITRAERDVIFEIDGRRPDELLSELYEQLPEADRQRMRYSLFLGLASVDAQQVYRHGDFLVRDIVGIDGANGSIAVAAHVQLGRVVQFHLRDAEASAADLDALLRRYVSDEPLPVGGLMFSCVGRGEGLYGTPDHDSQVFERIVGPVPLGGFFCSGEIGPVQGESHLHGYTSAFALFRPRRTH